MKILYVSPNAHLGGAERILEVLLKNHNRSQFSPAVFFLSDGPLVASWKAMGIPVAVSPSFRLRNPLQLWRAASFFNQFLAEFQPDLVHSTMAYGHLFAGPVCLKNGVPELWFQHGPVGGRLDWLSSKIPTSTIFCNSKFTEAQQKNLGRNASKVVYGPVYFDNQSTESQKDARRQTRAKLGLSADSIVMSHVARLDPWKGQDVFLRALAQLLPRYPQVRGLIVGGSAIGSQEYEEGLKKLSAQLGLSSSVQFLGHRDDVSAIMSASDIFIHSSTIAEPLGLVVLEAMAAGCVVVASNEGGPCELISEGKDGFLCPPRDPEALQKVLQSVLDQSSHFSEVGTSARIRVKDFSAAKWTESIERIYLELSKL